MTAPPALSDDLLSTISAWTQQDPDPVTYSIVGSELVSAYLGRIASLVPGDADRDLRWVYTPLHGVGAAVVAGAVAAGGFPAASVVADQAEPNPAFPTVAFPNPEEPGAIDLALAQAEKALGYCVDPAAVPDKDGISALVRVLALAAECKAQRSSLADRLDDIARRYGIYETDQLSVRVDDLKVIADAMARLRARPPKSVP